jgi:hypothetical protein
MLLASPQSVKSRDANGDEVVASELLLRLHGEERERNCAFKYLEGESAESCKPSLAHDRGPGQALLERQSLTGKEIAHALRASGIAQTQEG